MTRKTEHPHLSPGPPGHAGAGQRNAYTPGDEPARLRRELQRAQARADRLRERERAAVEGALRAERRLRAMEAVTGAALEHLELDRFLPAALRSVREALGADAAWVHLLSPDGANLALRAEDGLAAAGREDAVVPVGLGIAGRVARTRAALALEDTSGEAGLSPGFREAFRSLLAVPLAAHDRLSGVLQVGSAAARAFRRDERRLLEAMAARVALAIDHVRLLGDILSARGERERLVAELRRHAAELDATLEAVADGLIIHGPDGEVRRMNATARRVLRLAPEDLALGWRERVERYRPHDAAGRPLAPEELPLARALRGETVRGAVLELRLDDEPLWITSSAAPIRDDAGRLLGTVTTFSDVTRGRQAEEQREDLLRAVSHDLRTPLTSVLLQAQRLARQEDDDVRRRAQGIAAAVRRMELLLRDLVESARLESGQLALQRRPVPMARFVQELLAHTAALDPARVAVEGDALAVALADPDRLERVVVNLLSNALKYSPPGTPVRVTVARQRGQVLTAVADRGRGIPPDELPRLFQRYFRSREARDVEGTGLGLYIARLLVEAHGGRIRADNAPTGGCVFTFTLPAAP